MIGRMLHIITSIYHQSIMEYMKHNRGKKQYDRSASLVNQCEIFLFKQILYNAKKKSESTLVRLIEMNIDYI